MRRILLRLIALVVVLFVALVAGLFLVSGERLAKIASDQITTMSGRQVSLTGSLRPQFFPNLGVRTGPFEIAGTGGEGPMISGEALSVGVDFWALFSRRVDVKEITMIAPSLNFSKDSEGNANWSNSTTSTTDGEATELPDVSLVSLSIQDGTLRYRDSAVGTDLLLKDIDVTATMPDTNGALTVSLAFKLGNDPATADIQLGLLSSLLAGDLTQVQVSSTLGANTATFAGEAAIDGRFAGDLAISLPDPGTLLALSGGVEPTFPPEVMPINFKGVLSGSTEQIDITDASYGFGDNRMTGPLSVTLSDVPYLNANLTAGALDLAFLAADEGSAEPADGAGWSTDPIDASAVGLLNADVTVNAASIDFGSTALQEVTLQVTIEDARAVAEIQRALAFGGALDGRFVVNNRNGLSVAGSMDGRTVAVQALLTDLVGFDRMRGAGDTKLSFLGVGQNLDQIMRSLSGDASLAIGQGDITGFDLASLFGGSEAVGNNATTIFQSLNATFKIQDGIARNDDLSVTASLFEARGQGDIDLGNQRLDYLLQPRVFENQATGALSIPVRIEGPWSSPRIYPDLEFAAKERLRAEQDKLAEEAKAQLEEKKRDVEDQVKEKLEDELRRGLGGLFGD